MADVHVYPGINEFMRARSGTAIGAGHCEATLEQSQRKAAHADPANANEMNMPFGRKSDQSDYHQSDQDG
jgi:hypothetical protein